MPAKRSAIAVGISLVAATAALVGRGKAQDASPQNRTAGFPDIMGALRRSPGVLGVEGARTSSGKNVVYYTALG